MNIKDAFGAAQRFLEKMKDYNAIAAGRNNASSIGGRSDIGWNIQFIQFFEEMDFEERKLLREVEQYQTLLEIYDLMKEGKIPSQFIVQNANTAFSVMALYAENNKHFFKFASSKPIEDAIEITFPITSDESTTFEFNEEIDWFFKIFNRVSEDLSNNGTRPVVRSVDNLDVSIAVALDWKFLLAILLIWMKLQKNSRADGDIRAAIRALMDKGLESAEADALETKLSKGEDQIIDDARKEYETIVAEEKKSGWEASFTALAQHLFRARSKGYNLEFMAEANLTSQIAQDRPQGFIQAVKQLSYSRENDRGGAGKAELLEKPRE